MDAGRAIPALECTSVFGWTAGAARIVARQPADIVPWALCMVLLLGAPPVLSGLVALCLPAAYVLAMSLCCRRLLACEPGTPERLPWRRVIVLGGVACMPVMLAVFALNVVRLSGRGEFLLLLLQSASARVPVLESLGAATWILLWMCIPLLLVVAILFAPAFVVVRGYAVGPAIAASLRCWRRNPLAAAATLLASLLLLAGAYVAYVTATLSGAWSPSLLVYGYGLAVWTFAFAACVAASADMLQTQIVERPL